MIVGTGQLELNELTMMEIVQQYLNRECTHPPIVKGVAYRANHFIIDVTENPGEQA